MRSKPCGEAECCLGRGNMATSLEPDPMHRCYTDENLITGAAWPGHPECNDPNPRSMTGT
jgi:hypothetical protein